jgi:hypothetical protein
VLFQRSLDKCSEILSEVDEVVCCYIGLNNKLYKRVRGAGSPRPKAILKVLNFISRIYLHFVGMNAILQDLFGSSPAFENDEVVGKTVQSSVWYKSIMNFADTLVSSWSSLSTLGSKCV